MNIDADRLAESATRDINDVLACIEELRGEVKRLNRDLEERDAEILTLRNEVSLLQDRVNAIKSDR